MAAKHRPGRAKRPSKSNYNAAQKWLMNKVRKIVRHLEKCPNDDQPKRALDRAKSVAGVA